MEEHNTPLDALQRTRHPILLPTTLHPFTLLGKVYYDVHTLAGVRLLIADIVLG